MDERSKKLFNILSDYRDRRHFLDTPEEVETALDEALDTLSNDERPEADELETIARFIETSDAEFPEYGITLDVIRDYENRLLNSRH